MSWGLLEGEVMFRPKSAIFSESTTSEPSGLEKGAILSREPSLSVRWVNVIPAILPEEFVSERV